MNMAVGLALVAAGLADPGPPPCTLEAVVEELRPYDQVEGIERVELVLRDVRTEGCEPPRRVVVPSDRSELFVVGTPSWVIGARYRMELTPTPEPTVYALRLSEAAAALTLLELPLGGAPKAGNNQPPCAGIETLRWPSDRVELEAEIASVGDLDAEGVGLAWEAAAEAWSAPSCGGATLSIRAGDADADWSLRADGRSTVAFERASSSIFSELGLADGLGFTCWVCDEGGQIIESDVRFDGARVQWTDDCSAAGFDPLAAAVHEFGHVLGFAHDDAPESTMFAVTSPRRLLDVRRPAAPDVETLCERYPCAEADCGGAPALWEDCPDGAGICAPCEDDAACGASTDRCLRSLDGASRICGRACSASYPCGDGASCLVVAEGVRQCVPEGDSCPERSFVGEPCQSDDECGDSGDLCAADGRCGASCASLACPEESRCDVVLDADGRVESAQCVYEGLPPSKGGAKGGRCAAAPDAGGAVVLWILLFACRRRCVSSPV